MCCDTRVLSLAGFMFLPRGAAGCEGAAVPVSLRPGEGMDYARAQPPAREGCPGAPAQAAVPREGHPRPSSLRTPTP